MVAKDGISKALNEAVALAEKHELDDLENSFIGLQARQTSVEAAEMDGIMEPTSINMEKARIRKSLNFFLDKLEDELPEEEENEEENDLISPDKSKEEEIISLRESISHLTKLLTYLRDQALTESNPSTKFNIDTDIASNEKKLDDARKRLESLLS